MSPQWSSRPYCGHSGCQRRAVRVVAYERPNHKQFLGQSHACCSVHSRPLSATDYDYVDPPTPPQPYPETPEQWAGDRYLVCADPSCVEMIPDHLWGRTKAYSEGWFEQKDGTIWCPAHVPDWVDAWRARQKAKKEQS